MKAAISLILFADYFDIKQLLRVAFIMLETYHDDMDDNTGILDADTSIIYKLATKVEMEDTDRCYSMLEPDSEITSIFATSCMLFCAITFGVEGALRNKVINLVKRNVNLSAAMMGKLVGHPQYLKEWHAVHLNDRLYQ